MSCCKKEGGGEYFLKKKCQFAVPLRVVSKIVDNTRRVIG
jgi:hypothetical protein